MTRPGLAGLALLLCATAAAAAPPATYDRLQRADGTAIVPDRFLRSWDPVTVLLDRDAGPAKGGAEDHPERWAILAPSHPGAWTWLGPRTLQFRPATPWEPLLRETVTAAGQTRRLVPLLPLPVSAGPADSPDGLAGLDTVALTFPGPIDRIALARLLTIELTAQHDAAGTARQVLTDGDFDLSAVPQADPAARQTVLVTLHAPVPDGMLATLHLRLSDEPGLDEPSFSLPLHGATPFTLTDSYCGSDHGHTVTDGVMTCAPDAPGKAPELVLQFSAEPEAMDIVRARSVLRLTPSVDDLTATASGDNTLRLGGRFAPDTPYRLTIAPDTLKDAGGRPLAAPATLRFAFAAGTPQIGWDATEGIAERLGPQMIPVRGHGYDKADLRIHPIDPLARDFWPFPADGLATADDTPPPLPGHEPTHHAASDPITGDDMAARIAMLGSPAVSTLLPLPIHRGGADARFGIDLQPLLSDIAGPRQPGTYLVGLRATDGSRRQWLRLQVTDLALATVEEADRTRFVVTSLATAAPVAGAEIRLDGVRDNAFTTLAHGTTGADGSWTAAAPLTTDWKSVPAGLRRIVVLKATDTLVLQPGRGPLQYANGQWNKATSPWLDWMTRSPAPRDQPPQTLCHLFTERPIYRPAEPVLIAGMIRRYGAGTLSYPTAASGEVLVTGPSSQQWHIPAPLDQVGGFHVRFDAKTEATGDYTIQYVPRGAQGCGLISVKKEAYRLPTFEVLLQPPPRAALDTPFTVGLLARFYAGGMLDARPLTWRVTQFPAPWTPPGRDGYLFSSDSRYSGDDEFRSTPVLGRDARTDDGGAASITLDPTAEPTAQPRQYLVEATVTGDDDMQVRATQRITVLPPFVLGLKVPRYLPSVGSIDPEVLALDGAARPVAGLKLTVRLVHRQWNPVLVASDFAQGSPKYDTQTIDMPVAEQTLTSGTAPTALHFPIKDAGVYLVELEAEDKVGRKQLVRVDLFVAGDTPVTWSKPPSQVVTISTDRTSYAPGDTATLIVQSPFQSGRALAIVEQPDGRFDYDWLDIRNGYARTTLRLRKQQGPRLAVHVLLMRGRIGTPTAAPFDQDKPATLAASAFIKVAPVDNQLKLRFDAPASAHPGQNLDLVLHLSDPAGHPLPGEATVWMLDQAVLSLAPELPLDPLPAFIVDRQPRLLARDTRNLAFGLLPLTENPGGDEKAAGGLENISVRKNFTPVPLYLPRVKFGPDGTAHVPVHLPDSLTVFMLRAEAVSGPDRFGFGSGQLPVRQPVVAQLALPRFVRPGDSFTAGLIGRLVEGAPGPGQASLAVQNLTLAGPAQQNLTWTGSQPAHVDTVLTVPDPAPGTTSVQIRAAMERSSDHVGDALQIDLPIRPDRPILHRRDLLATGSDGLALPAIAEPLRPASYRRGVTLATDPDLVRLLAGIGALQRFPVGGTEQRIALASGELALLPFTPLMDASGLAGRLGDDVAAARSAAAQSTDDNGLVAFWPHTRGSVWLTAETYRMLVGAARLGQPVDKGQMDRLHAVLLASLRSDYPHLPTDTGLFERVAALTALADGGQIPPADADELARRAQNMPTDSVAEIATVLSRLSQADPTELSRVMDLLWTRINVLSRDGHPVYGGMADFDPGASILPSEARSLALAVQAVSTATPADPRNAVLRTALVQMADGNGWGSTDATAAALRALAAAWQAPPSPVPASILLPDRTMPGILDRDHPLLAADTTHTGPVRVQAPAGLAVLSSADYVPAAPGAQAPASQNGFVLARTLYRVLPNVPLARIDPAADGSIALHVGDVVEEVDELTSPQPRSHVALHMPLAAGMEPLNPALATATADATPSAAPTVAPDWSSYGDDEVLAVWLDLPAGTATLRTRLRATIPGRYTQPPATAEMLYRLSVTGSTAGRLVVVTR